MKGKKLLAGLLSAAMVLGTMVMPAFADSVSVTDGAGFKTAIVSGNVISLENDITCDGSEWGFVTGISNLTINGNNHAITFDEAIYSGMNGDAIIHNGTNLNVSDLTIKFPDGDTTSNGFYASNSTFDNVTIHNGYAGILNNENVTIKNCNFKNQNYISIYSDDNGNTEGTKIENCTFTDTRAYIARSNEVITGNVVKLEDKTNVWALTIAHDATATISRNSLPEGTTLALYENNSTIKNNAILGNISADSSVAEETVDIIRNNNMTSQDDIEVVLNGVPFETFAAALAVANDGDTLDMCGNTVELDSQLWINKEIEIKNGTFDFDDCISTDSSIIWIYNDEQAINPTFTNVTFKGSNYDSAYGVIFNNNLQVFGDNVVTLKDCTFNLRKDNVLNENAAKGNGALSGNGTFNKFIIDNCTFNLTNTGRVFKCMSVEMKDTTITATTQRPYYNHAFRMVEGTIEDCTITATGDWESAIKNVDGESLEIKGNSNISLSGDIILEDEEVGTTSTITVADTASLTTTGTDGRVAKIGNVYYATLEAALEAATANDTVTMLADATPVLTFAYNKYLFTNAKALDLNGHKLTFNQGNVNVNNIEFKSSADEKGTIVVSYGTVSPSYNGAIWITEENSAVTFNNVVINANKLKDTYLVECWAKDTNVTFNDCEISAVSTNDSAGMSAVVACNNVNTAVTVNNTKITHKNIDGHTLLGGNITIKGTSVIDSNNVACGIFAGNSNTQNVSIEDTAKITIGNVAFSHDWNPEKAGIVLGKDTVYTVEDTATVNANVYRTPSTENLANTVKVSFTDVTENEGEKVYDIYVEADSEKTINRLMSVQMALDFETDDTIEMTVNAAEGLSRSFENGMYLFNFDGETRPSATGTKIKIGQVKMTGYGAFNLVIDAEKDNKVHAAELNGENVVTDFVTTPVDGQGTFDISTSLEDVEIKVPTRKLTINVDFNNSVENQVAAYQDMTVTVTGPKSYEKGIKLGSDETLIENNKVVIEIADELTLNETYTVEVAGAGYRTAIYSVNMNADKTLNFWNNAKDTAVEVEVGKEASKKNTTFLAGELVKDGKINIYDLSAVVSYFGTINNVNAESEYAKYDLNRDGKIDSKDVAYVLVSWGK